MTKNTQHDGRKEFPSLYVLKALCALFVVMIHTAFVGKSYLSPVIRIAVPCFYILSGYFLYAGNSQKERMRAWRWVKKAFLLMICLTVIYYFWASFCAGSWVIMSLKELTYELLTGTNLSVHLWYIPALWEALIVFMVLRRWLPGVIPFCVLLFALHLGAGRYYVLIDQSPYDSETAVHLNFLRVRLNFLSVALPCLSVGYCIRKWHDVINARLSPLKCVIISALLLYTEEFVLTYFNMNNGVSYDIFTLPLAASVFLLFLQSRVQYPRFLVYVGKDHSQNVYFFHPIVIGLISMMGVFDSYARYMMPALAYVVSLIVSLVIVAARRRWLERKN